MGRWKEFQPLIKSDQVYIDTDANKFGSRPRELFEDLIETLEEEYDKDRAIMKDIYRNSTITVNSSTTFEEFNALMEKQDERMKETNPQNVMIIYNELLSKAKDREAREAKRKKRAKEEFMAALKKSGIASDASTWDQIKGVLSDKIDSKVTQGYTSVFLNVGLPARRGLQGSISGIFKQTEAQRGEEEEEGRSGISFSRSNQWWLPRRCPWRALRREKDTNNTDRNGSTVAATLKMESAGGVTPRGWSLFFHQKTLSWSRYHSDDDYDPERTKRHKKEKHRERKRERHEKDKSKTSHKKRFALCLLSELT